MSTPFSGIPWKIARRYLFVFFFGYLGSLISSGKKSHSKKARQGHIKYVSVQNISKTARSFDLNAAKCKTHSLASYLLGFSVYSILGVKCDLILTSKVFDYLRYAPYKHALEHLQAARSGKNGSFSPPLRLTPDYY